MSRFLRPCLPGLLLGTALLALPAAPIFAQTFSSGSTGADGPFNPPTSVPAGTTVNGSTYTVPLAATGIYNFTTITVPSGVTVTFVRNASNSPVILLATGNVTIAGIIDVSGAPGSSFQPGRGGPGGFDGGVGGDGLTTNLGGAGLGPGGGSGGTGNGVGGGHAGYGSAGSGGCLPSGATNGPTYGSSLLRPVVGGSGGGGASGYLGSGYGGGGGGGGGAIQFASSTLITLTGTIRANGGSGVYGAQGNSGGSGSGGAIRLTAPTITVTNGTLSAQGGSAPCSAFAGVGRIRLEGSTLTYSGTSNPLAMTGLPQPFFPGTGAPALVISAIGGMAVPANPFGSALKPPDVVLPMGTANPVAVDLSASNVSVGTTVQVSATPQNGVPTAGSCTLAGTLASSTCIATFNISLTQTNVITATATFPLLSSAGIGPLYVDGDAVTHIRVAAVLGGGSSVTYLTRSGREILAR